MLFTVEVATAIFFFIMYCAYGRACWATLCGHASTYDDLEMVVASKSSCCGRIGTIVFMLTWPLWYTLPKIVMALRTAGQRAPVVR